MQPLSIKLKLPVIGPRKRELEGGIEENVNLNCRLSSRFRPVLTAQICLFGSHFEAEEKEMEDVPLRRLDLPLTNPQKDC